MAEHFCPNCNANLNEQTCFDEYEDDWECTECYAHLHHDYSDDEYELIDKNDELKEHNEDEKPTDSSFDAWGLAAAVVALGINALFSTAYKHYEKEEAKREARKKARYDYFKKHWKDITISMLSLLLSIVLIVSLYIGISYLNKLTPIGINSSDIIGLNYTDAVIKLNDNGFSNINLVNLDDLSIDDISKENIVCQILISDENEFNKDDKYAYDAKIIIKYHSVKLLEFPFSAKEAKGKNYKTIKNQLQKIGFINVTTVPIYDVVLGWFTDDGEVEKITINDKNKIKEGETFRPDDKIIITYHTLKKNKK